MNRMNIKHNNTGMTLIEVLIAAVIFLLVSAIMSTMIIKSKTMWQSSSTRASARQELQLISWRVSEDLQGSNVSYVTDGSSGNLSAFSILSAYDKNGNFITNDEGSASWQKYIIYYVKPGTNRLLRKEVFMDFKNNPSLIRPLTIQELSGYMDGTGNLQSPSITLLKLSVNPGNNSASFSCNSSATSQHGTQDQQSVLTTINVYNN
jgi:prepilin-type N-terminal cleavage/methylation domain-containing protein